MFAAKPSDHGKINSITMTPNPPVKGQKLNITADITIGKYFQWVGYPCYLLCSTNAAIMCKLCLSRAITIGAFTDPDFLLNHVGAQSLISKGIGEETELLSAC